MADIDYSRLADFRHLLRNFLNFSEKSAAAEGLAPQQHQALLAHPAGGLRVAPTVGILAERLCLKHHTAVELVQRLGKGRPGGEAAPPRRIAAR